MTDFDETVNKIVAELKKRKAYLEQIKTLAEKQQAALEKADSEEITRILEARGSVMKEVDALNASKSGTEDSIAGECPPSRPDQYPDAFGIVREIEELIRDIQSIDSRNLENAQRLRDDLRKRLQEVSDHRKSRELYKGEGKGISGAFVNKRR